MTTPKCVNPVGCGHSCCDNCPKETGQTADKTTKQKSGGRSSEEIRLSYTQAAPPRPYPGSEASAEPQPGLTLTPATAHSFAAPGTASARYASDIATLPGSTFENASCIAPQSLIFDSTTTSFEDSLELPSSGSLSFGFPTFPSAPLLFSTVDFDFEPIVSTSFPDPEDEEYQFDFAGAPTVTQDHIAALHMDRDLVQVPQVAGSTQNPVQDKDNDAHTASAQHRKRPRSASPGVPAKTARKAPSPRSAKMATDQKDEHILTCPFVWVDHQRHSKCLNLRLRRIRDVKQHLHRVHEQPYYCRRCKATFKNGADSAEAQAHDNSDIRCPRRDHAKIPDGITKLQFDSMKKSKADFRTQWYYIWDVLFPDAIEAKPRSPFLNDRLSNDITALSVFSQTQGRRILQANPSLTTREIDLVLSGIEVVLDAWTSRS